MFCKNCGHDITPSEKHCPFCGNPSGFPEGMNGDSKLSVVRDAEEIVGEIVSEAVISTGGSRKPAAKPNSDIGTASTDSPTVVFPAVSSTPKPKAEASSAYDDDYVLTPSADDGYDEDYDDNFDDNYDDGYDDYQRRPSGLPLTNRQIGIIAGVAAFVIMLIVVVLLLSKCGGDNDSVVGSSSDISSTSSEVTSSETSSGLSSVGAVSFTSSARPTSQPTYTPPSSTASSSSDTSSESSTEPTTSTEPSSSTDSSAPSEPTSSTETSTPSNPATSAPEDVGEDTGNEPSNVQ